jgi:hypothetical protein
MVKYLFSIIFIVLLLGVGGCHKHSRRHRVYKDSYQTHAPLKMVTRKESKRGLFSSNKSNKKKYHTSTPVNTKKTENKNTAEPKKEKKNDSK